MDRAASSANRTSAAGAVSTTATPSSRRCYFRWVICALLLFGTTKNYMDRQVLGVLKSTLQHDLGWNEIDYSNLVFAFQTAYAVGLVVVGRVVDHSARGWVMQFPWCSGAWLRWGTPSAVPS